MKRIAAFLVAVALISPPAFATRPEAAEGPTKKITNEVVNAVTDELVGKETKPQSGQMSLPPGLAKKDKVPPGWDKGKKEGWKKEPQEEEPSLIQKWVGAIFEKVVPAQQDAAKQKKAEELTRVTN